MLSHLKAAPLRRQALATARRSLAAGTNPMNRRLQETDPDLHEIMEREKQRQVRVLLCAACVCCLQRRCAEYGRILKAADQ